MADKELGQAHKAKGVRYGGRKARPLAELEAAGSTQALRLKKVRLAALREARRVAIASPAIHIPQPGNLIELIKTVPNYDPYIDAGDCIFDAPKAAAAIDFFHSRLVLVEGRDAGKPFELMRHQQAEIANLYGWRRPDGTRRFREAYISEARKNGKSTRVAGMVVYELAEPIEEGSQIYSAASRRDQAKLVFRLAAQMCQRSEGMKEILRVWKHSIVNLADELTTYQAISAEATGAHGYNPQFVVMDEMHLQESRDLYDALKSGMGARDQPLLVSITTAGHDRESICYETYQHARSVMRTGDNRVADQGFFPAIYELGEHEDWTDESLWCKANPNLGVTVKLPFLQEAFHKAQSNPALQNVFRQLHLNQWTQSAMLWLDMADWDLCKSDDEPPVGAKCYGGLDLGAKWDVTAFVLVFRVGKKFIVRPHFWIPSDNLAEHIRRDHVPYDRWAKAGIVTITPGPTTNYDYIRSEINRLGKEYKISGVGYDPAMCSQLAGQLGESDGFNMVLMRQGFLTMSEPAKFLEKLVLEADLVHDGNPMLRSHAEYCAVEVHRTGLIMPHKKQSQGRIDGIVALVMALRLATMDNVAGSVYDRRAVRSI